MHNFAAVVVILACFRRRHVYNGLLLLVPCNLLQWRLFILDFELAIAKGNFRHYYFLIAQCLRRHVYLFCNLAIRAFGTYRGQRSSGALLHIVLFNHQIRCIFMQFSKFSRANNISDGLVHSYVLA